MRSLHQKFEELEDLLLNHRRTLAQNTGVPFIRLMYPAKDEHSCHRFCDTLVRTLKQRDIPVEVVSCRGVLFTHYEETDRLEPLFELEPNGGDRLAEHIAIHARRELAARIERAAERLNEDGVIFLTETAFTYPYLHLSTVLDDCTNRIRPPLALVVFYPGEVDVDGQLLFLGQRPSGYYRTRDLI